MTDPKSKDETLSVGAKTYCEKLAKELVYGYDEVISSKAMEKGINCEQQSIDLYNSVFFTNHAKNTERKSNEFVTGECDIFTGDKIIDIKTSWSLCTFPSTAKSAADKGYEWQLRAYAWLWGVQDMELAFCMVNTPDELIGYEDSQIHYVDHITEQLRVTLVRYKRDQALEEKIALRCAAASEYLDSMVRQIADEHSF